MDYQEAIERHIEECKHRIDVISDFMKTNCDADKDKCCENIAILYTAISAMQELEKYKQLGTLQEVREAVEKQIPEKKEKVIKGHRMGIVSCAFADGWNACIDAITRGKTDD